MKRLTLLLFGWLLLAGSVCAQVSTTSLVSVWELDEASGNAVDAFGSNTLTENNTVPATTGKINGARDFNGSNDFFDITDNASLSTGDIDFSITAWVKIDSTGSAQFIVSKYNVTGSQREYTLSYSTTANAFMFTVSATGSSTTSSAAWGSTPTTGVWYFIACGHSAAANEVWLSVDGGTPVTAAHSTGVLDGTSAFCLGQRPSADLFNGTLDQVTFWKRDIRSDSTIPQLYNSGNGLAYSSWGGGGSGNGVVYPLIIGQLTRPTPWTRFVSFTPLMLEAR